MLNLGLGQRRMRHPGRAGLSSARFQRQKQPANGTLPLKQQRRHHGLQLAFRQDPVEPRFLGHPGESLANYQDAGGDWVCQNRGSAHRADAHIYWIKILWCLDDDGADFPFLDAARRQICGDAQSGFDQRAPLPTIGILAGDPMYDSFFVRGPARCPAQWSHTSWAMGGSALLMVISHMHQNWK